MAGSLPARLSPPGRRADTQGMRRAIVLAAAATVVLAACSHAKSPPDAAVTQFCADTAGLGEMLKTPGSGAAAAARLADFDRRLTADVEALQQAGDAGVAAEAQLIQTIVASQMTGAALGAEQNPQLEHAASLLADVRDKTC